MFPMMSDLEHLFICLFYLLYVSNKCSNFCYIKDMVFVFLLLNFESISCILNVSPLVDLYQFKMFSLKSVDHLFIFKNNVINRTKFLNFVEVQFVNFLWGILFISYLRTY